MHMKKLIHLLIIIILLFACKNTEKRNKEKEISKAEIEKKVTKRDYSIQTSNAYSDIFFDSLLMEKFIIEKNLSDSLTRRIRSFYNARNFQFAWFDSKGLDYQALNFWNLHEYYRTYSSDKSLNDKNLESKMDFLVGGEKVNIKNNDTKYTNIELTLTEHFIRYILNNYKNGEIKRKEMERFVPLKKQDALVIADSLLTKKHKDNKYYTDVNESYKLLLQQLHKYFSIAQQQNWPTINIPSQSLKKGEENENVKKVKKRLSRTGEMDNGDTTNLFNDALENALKNYQRNRGLKPTGILTKEVVQSLNMPAKDIIKKILINLDRMRWVLNHTRGNLLEVNIPEFVLHVYEGKKEEFNMPVVVGKEGHNTTIFTGNLNQIVFSPYWNVTPSIVRNEILPAMERNSNYLEQNNMEQTGVDENGLPVIRQLPGEKNSLGKVKFLFPNSYNIYLHDTPAKSLFSQDKRAYSHGCIRLSNPSKLAIYLLRNQKDWTPDKITEAMNKGVEQVVRLKEAVPVLITYYTAWVNGDGQLQFRDDIYNHDAELLHKMFIQ